MTKLVFNIGHGLQANGTIDPGAVNATHKVTEHDLMCRLAGEIARKLASPVQAGRVQLVYQNASGYAGLPARINALMPNWIVSLHANAFVRQATGTEVLYYCGSKNGKALADKLRGYLLNALHLPDRGSKPCTRSDDRGGYLLYATAAPCVIAEPFFLTNDSEYEYVMQHFDALVQAYVDFANELLEA